jgi:hypothetical protein
MEYIPSTGEDLMTVSLVPHIPYDLVVRGIEYMMEGNSKFHHTQTGTKVPGIG